MGSFLQDVIPEGNRIEVWFARHSNSGSTKTEILETAYSSGFIGAFLDRDDMPTWARRAAEYLDREFEYDTPGTKKLFSDVANQLADGDGERYPNFRYALEFWERNGKKGVEPYTAAQDYGSCVDASCSEHETTMFGWRAAQQQYNEIYIHPAAWYKYANRGYCSDGWSGSGIAAVARRVGCAFRCKYELPGGTVDFTDDDENERIVARKWCRSGIPEWLAAHTSANHGYADGAITRYDGDVAGLKKVMKAGGVLHAGGTRTSGGPKPFTPGRTGSHMQSVVGYDDTDECRKWFRDNHDIVIPDDDFPIICHQTWGSGWRGECGDSYWPKHLWGPKPQGAWVCSAKWFLSDIEYAWLPWAKGFVNPSPTPPQPQPVPQLLGSLWVEQAGVALAVRGEIQLPQELGGHKYIAVPDGFGKYRFIPKQTL